MGLSFAIDELVASGWTCLDSSGCGYDSDGRVYPTTPRVRQEFLAAGFELSIARVDAHRCYRATWREAGQPDDAGTVVGFSESEAAVFALAQLRRSLAGMTA